MSTSALILMIAIQLPVTILAIYFVTKIIKEDR